LRSSPPCQRSNSQRRPQSGCLGPGHDAARHLQHRPQSHTTRQARCPVSEALLKTNMANCSLSLLTGGAAARLSAASPSTDTTQQAAPSPPNAGAVCRHRSATARIERTWQRNHQQLPRPYQLSAPSRGHREGTALVFTPRHNKCQVLPAIAHSFLNARLTPVQVAPLQFFIGNCPFCDRKTGSNSGCDRHLLHQPHRRCRCHGHRSCSCSCNARRGCRRRSHSQHGHCHRWRSGCCLHCSQSSARPQSWPPS